MSNNFGGKKDSELVQIGQTVATAIGDENPNPYGTSPAQLAAINTSDAAMAAAMQAQADAKAAEKASTQTKTAKKKLLVAALNSIAGTVYNNPAVTDAMIAALGFEPRKKKTTTTPQQPTNLVATPKTDATVTLKWDRNGNSAGTVFVIETSPDEIEWSLVHAVTRTTYKADGFTPGVRAWFRVTATTATTSSPASQAVAIYGPPETAVPSLKVA